MEKFCLGLGFGQKALDQYENEFKPQEWLKTTVGSVSDKASGVFVCASESYEGLTIAVNVEDHVTLKVESSSLKKALKVAVAIHNKLNDHKILAYDNTHGYVSVDPKRSGNAMRISATLQNIDDAVIKDFKQNLNVKQLDSSKVEL
jgi:protein-arginine kinase